ncbi:MAG: ComF family protein [Proteobacteria bacterium]|nr:ComF family protein [Pseudomonadota bacterium]
MARPDTIKNRECKEESVLGALFSILVPPVCTLCNEDIVDHILCAGCSEEFEKERLTGPACPLCSEPFLSKETLAHTCTECAAHTPPFVQATSLYLYRGQVLEALHGLKYRGTTKVARPLGLLLSEEIKRMDRPPDVIVPVPLHTKRLQKRSFNQSVLMARVCSNSLAIPLDYKGLMRVRDTGAQVGLSRAERAKNIKGAFALADAELYRGKNVLLIDDVYTTGATMRECATLFKAAGAATYGLTLARAAKFS